MARLIPSFFDDRTPPGERDVFNMLAAGPDDWVALHSLDLAPWNRGLRTEIDFVVIVPDTGVACLEVKSHDSISFENGQWHPPEIKRSQVNRVRSLLFGNQQARDDESADDEKDGDAKGREFLGSEGTNQRATDAHQVPCDDVRY